MLSDFGGLREHFLKIAVQPCMRKSFSYEIIAAVSAMLGALIIVWVYYPALNPIQYEIDSHEDLPSVGYYLIMTPIPLAILWVSWKLNRKAQQIKREEKQPENNTKEHGLENSMKIFMEKCQTLARWLLTETAWGRWTRKHRKAMYITLLVELAILMVVLALYHKAIHQQ